MELNPSTTCLESEHSDESLSDTRSLANQPPVIRFVNLLIREAHEARASDINLELTWDRDARPRRAPSAERRAPSTSANVAQFREASGTNWAYGYDALDRMVSVHRNGTLIARYAYDVLGRRIVKRVYSEVSGGDSAYTRFVYRGSHVGFETDSAGTIGLKYTWGAGTDQLLAITDGATHYYATTDRLGSVRSLAKRDGTWALTQRFSPYGVRMSRDTSASYGLGLRLRYGWTGREWDQETVMSYHRARYILPTIRRWTQEDPIGYGGGGNVYAYVNGQAFETADPSGLIRDNVVQGFIPFCSEGGSCLTATGAMHGLDVGRLQNEAALFLQRQGSSGGGSRPLELSADAEAAARVRVGGTEFAYDSHYTALIVRDVLAASPTLRAEAAAENVYVYVRAGRTAGLNPGLTEYVGLINGLPGYRITLDSGDIPDLLTHPTYGAGIRANGGLIIDDVVGHELHVHVYNRRSVPRDQPETICVGCSPTVAVQLENGIRVEAGRPERRY